LSTRCRPLEKLVSEIERLAREIPSPTAQIVIAIDPAGPAVRQDSESVGRAAAALAHWNQDATRPVLAWEGLPGPSPTASCVTVPPLRPQFIGRAPRAC